MEYRERKTHRLKNYDYGQYGYYFVTICTANRGNLLSTVLENNLRSAEEYSDLVNPTAIGEEVIKSIYKMAQLNKNVEIDKFVLMPNHIHAIIIIRNAPNTSAPVGNDALVVPAIENRNNAVGVPAIENRNNAVGVPANENRNDTVGVPANENRNDIVGAPVEKDKFKCDDEAKTYGFEISERPDRRCLQGLIRDFKSVTTRKYKKLYNTDSSLWQKSFYDVVIRSQAQYENIWRYIDENPLKWKDDDLYNSAKTFNKTP